jgi:hypothetical protein
METQEEKYVWDSFDNENSLPPKGLGFSEGFRVKSINNEYSVLRWRLSSLSFAHIL